MKLTAGGNRQLADTKTYWQTFSQLGAAQRHKVHKSKLHLVSIKYMFVKAVTEANNGKVTKAKSSQNSAALI